jgi:thiamine biosynthesis protein ThiS
METIRIIVNGEERAVPTGLSLVDLIRSLNLEPSRVAVELNREIVRREAWTETVVAGGARLEIVQFVGGG